MTHKVARELRELSFKAIPEAENSSLAFSADARLVAFAKTQRDGKRPGSDLRAASFIVSIRDQANHHSGCNSAPTDDSWLLLRITLRVPR